MNTIPSNFTLEEAVNYVPEFKELSNLLDPFLEKVILTEVKLDKLEDRYERLDEQDTFKYDLLEAIQTLCKQTGSKKELVKAITLAIEDSYVEM